MRAAAIDLGSNTFHTLVAEVEPSGITAVVHDEKLPLRLGDTAFTHGRISPPAIVRGLSALEPLLARARAHVPDQLRILATGVFRDAANGRAFITEAMRRHAIEVELLDGRTEATLTWLGVSAELAGGHGRLVIVDVGGGSLECVSGTAFTSIELAHSAPLGVLRLRGLDRPALHARVATTLGPIMADIRAHPLDVVAISSGTARALLRLARALGLAGALQRHLAWHTIDDLAELLAPLPAPSLGELGVEPARADTIAIGAMLLAAALDLLGRPIVYVARHALREGALVDVARRHHEAACSFDAPSVR
jgi:exopolyphosphatase / guanosine-5'-triphosphate,3'-diphosphate pyrophosphatase